MKKSMGIILGLILAVGVSTGAAKAYQEGEADPSANNTQLINGLPSGEVEVNGWIGTFDPTAPEDPEKPQPPVTDSSWVNVTIPKKVLFGSLASDAGKIYGPTYTLTNHSVKGVKISVDKTELTTDASNLDADILLNLVAGSTTVNLTTDGVPNTTSTEIVTLATAGTQDFTLSGTFKGTYPAAKAAATPVYKLTLGFEAV